MASGDLGHHRHGPQGPFLCHHPGRTTAAGGRGTSVGIPDRSRQQGAAIRVGEAMSLLRRIWNVVRRNRLDEDLRQELDAHLALIEEEERESGASGDDASRRARARFGNPLLYRERAQDAVIAAWLEGACKEIMFAARRL